MKRFILILLAGFLPVTGISAMLYPFEVSYFHLQVQGEKLNMAYMDVQAIRPNGKTVVLPHGKNFICLALLQQEYFIMVR